MDRIRKALDLAKEQRARPADVLPQPSAAADVRRNALSKPELRAVGRPTTDLSYTTTRTFSASSELLEANRIIDASHPSAATSAFKMLRTQVLQRMQENQWRSIAVVSPGMDDGKTTMAINLAVSLANDHRHTVLLVDFDLKIPSIAAKLGIAPEMGADDVLRGHAEIGECLYHPDGFDRLVVLPARGPMENSSETLAGLRCREVVAELRERYPDRILVFDLPPVLTADDALAFTPLVDCALVVVAEGSTRREDLLRCMEILRKTPVIGTVLNRATGAQAAYS